MRVTKEQQKQINNIAKKYNLDLILIFGSFANGKIHKESDIDIAARTTKSDFSFKELSGMIFDLQEVFGFENEVDLAIINYADPFFLKKITEKPQLIYGTERDLAELKIYAFKQFIDHQKYFKMEKNFVNKYIASKLKKTA